MTRGFGMTLTLGVSRTVPGPQKMQDPYLLNYESKETLAHLPQQGDRTVSIGVPEARPQPRMGRPPHQGLHVCRLHPDVHAGTVRPQAAHGWAGRRAQAQAGRL